MAKFFTALVAITSTLQSALIPQFIRRSLSANSSHVSYQATEVDDMETSCPVDDPFPAGERTVFGTRGCTVFGYPSDGGLLIKEADLVDMLFLSLPRHNASWRSLDHDDEDKFCDLLRRTGATWWANYWKWTEAEIGFREATEEELRVTVFGWPADGVGVWVLRFESEKRLPRDFGRVHLAINMEERIQIMKEYGAVFVEDASQVAELRDG